MINLTIIGFILITFTSYMVVTMQHQREREKEWQKERKDLLDRIMAKDITEYKGIIQEPVKYEPVTVTEEKEYYMEIEEQKR